MSKLISSKYNRIINFVHPVNERYSCGICLNIADEPMNCANPEGCEGVYCSKCFATVLVGSNSCPSCKFEIASQPIKYRLAEDLIADEEVYCIYATDSIPACEWHGQLKALQAHLDTECTCFPVLCTNEGCFELVPRHHLATHLASECGYRLTQCQYCLTDLQVHTYEAHGGDCSKFVLTCDDCGGSYLREDTTAHDATCPDKLVTCPFACHGCVVPVLRKDAERHQANEGANHAVLVAQRLSLVEEKLSAAETELCELVDQRVSEAKAQLADDAAIGDLKLSSALLKRISDLEAAQSSVTPAVTSSTKTFSWIISRANYYFALRSRRSAASIPFSLECADSQYTMAACRQDASHISFHVVMYSGSRNNDVEFTGSIYFNDDVSSIRVLKEYNPLSSTVLNSTMDFTELSKYINKQTDTLRVRIQITTHYKEVEI